MNATTRFHALDLSSRYQAICGVAERQPVGYEALLTATDPRGHAVPPATLFELAAARGETVYLDWMARALHLRNFDALDIPASALLFVNVSPLTALEDMRFPTVFAAVMDTFEIDPARVVIEILEDAVENEARLADAAAYYRAFGCRIALDDFDSSDCGSVRLVRLRPDIVKVARCMVRDAAVDAGARRLLAETVDTIHAFGASVVLEGVETREEAVVAIDTGAECVQGYFFARPGTRRPDEVQLAERLSVPGPIPERASPPAPPRGRWRARASGMAS